MLTYSGFWNRVNQIISASIFGRLFLFIVNTIKGAFHNSWMYSFFTSRNVGEYGSNSKLAVLYRKLIFESKFSQMVSESACVRFICHFPEYIFSSKISLLSFYLIPSGILMFVRFYGNIGNMICFAFIIVLGMVLLSFKASIGTIISGSGILGRLFGFFGIQTETYRVISLKKTAFIALFMGLAVGGSSFFLNDKLSFIIFAAFLVFPIIAASPILLITLSIFGGIAFSTIPASIMAGVTIIIVLCRIFCKMEHLPKLRAVYVICSMYLFVTLYYTFFGYGGSDSVLAGAIQSVFLLFFFCIIVVINTKEKFKKLIYAISTCTIYTGLLGIYQRFSGQGGTGWSYTNEYVGGLRRISATFANPNVYGEFIILAICIIIAAILLSDGFRQKMFFIACLVLQIINLGLTYSRGCYISAAFAIFLIIWCCDKRLLSVAVFGVPFIPYVLPQNIITRILSVGSYLKDGSVIYRFSIWKGCLRIIENHWFVGSGVGTVAFTAFYQNYMLNGVTAQHSHNSLIQITIELSVVALVLMLLIIIYTLKDIGHTVKYNNNIAVKFYIIPFIAALAGIMIEGMVDYIFYNNIVYMFFWTVLAILIAGLNITDAQSQKIART